jgi:hypothetical protein
LGDLPEDWQAGGMPEPDERTDGPDDPQSVRDRWWFSAMLQIVAGAAIVAFQWGPISGGTANWANWLVGLAGVLVAGYGALGLLIAQRDRPPVE